jgi:hypothetical protein
VTRTQVEPRSHTSDYARSPRAEGTVPQGKELDAATR